LSEESLLVSNEVIHTRSQVLSENLKKWGNPNVIVTSNDPKDFGRLAGFFDIIVVDAPCSGEGLFRRDPSAIGEWSESNASLCAQRQRRILADVWPALAEDGMLVYSTCTFNPAENEENMEWLAGFAPVEPVRLSIPEEWGVKSVYAGGIPCYRFYPHKVRGEGFFIAGVRKKEAVPAFRHPKSKNGLAAVSKHEQAMLNETLLKLPLALLKFGDNILAWPESLVPSLEAVRSCLRIVHAGVKVGEIVRDTFNPAHELALSPVCNRSEFPCKEVTLEQAISFLKKEDVLIPFSEKGWNLVRYNGQPIGWAKNIGSRYNNNYPREWRIRMSTTEFTGTRLQEEAAKFPFPHS
jgi:NOL1/NOP2/fmu family ribosome biogenesis protein